MAGQIAHNFDEEDGWMIPAPLWGEMKFRIHTSRKGIIKKKKKKSLMQNLHPAIKQGRTQGKDSGCRGILLLAARVCQKNTSLALGWTRLFAFRQFLSGPDNPDICNYSISICF